MAPAIWEPRKSSVSTCSCRAAGVSSLSVSKLSPSFPWYYTSCPKWAHSSKPGLSSLLDSPTLALSTHTLLLPLLCFPACPPHLCIAWAPAITPFKNYFNIFEPIPLRIQPSWNILVGIISESKANSALSRAQMVTCLPWVSEMHEDLSPAYKPLTACSP